MLGHQRIGHNAVLAKCAGGADLIEAHQPRIPGDISRQYRRQAPFHALVRHEAPVG